MWHHGPMLPEIKFYTLIVGEASETYRRISTSPGEESFDITICTPKALGEECAANGFVLGRHRLVVSAYDPLLIISALRKLVTRCSGHSWAEVGSRIARIALWEFEDCQDAR